MMKICKGTAGVSLFLWTNILYANLTIAPNEERFAVDLTLDFLDVSFGPIYFFVIFGKAISKGK